MKNEEKVKKKYDFIAQSYHNMRTKEHPQGWFYNEFLEMPAVIEMLGNVKGKKILDMGCGTGIYAKILRDKGAKVKGFDISEGMIEIAKKENPNIDLRVGNVEKIPFNEKFDIILASLVVHYLPDWDKMLRQVKSHLNKGGYFIFSTGNPVSEKAEKKRINGKKFRVFGNYFDEGKITGIWHNVSGPDGKKRDIEMFSYHITYETLIKRILNNGFEIVGYKDSFPSIKAKKLFPNDYDFCSKVPYFTVWKVRVR